MHKSSVITTHDHDSSGIYAPGHLGELTQVVDFALVDAVLEETGAREKRLRLLPARVASFPGQIRTAAAIPARPAIQTVPGQRTSRRNQPTAA